jgi:hypothetical protein
MASSITYGSYNFPEPLPLVAEEDQLVSVAGQYDHSAIRVNLVGYLTGADLSALDSQKMSMINGLLEEYQDLTVTVENYAKTCPKSFIENISFSDSDVTTFLPYSLSFLYYSGETFSDFFKVSEPANSWEYSEGENRTVTAKHTVSAKGLKIGDSSELDNAKHYVNSKLQEGFENIALFNSGASNAYLTSRSENIDRSANSYSVTEDFVYSTSHDYSENQIFENLSGIVEVSSSISFSESEGLSVSLQGSVQGNIDANTGSQEGLLSTGDFSPENATEVALNSVVGSYSNYESGIYSFILNGPTSFSYDLDTGANTLGFSFNFSDPENLDIINDEVVHSYSTSIQVSKDEPNTKISVQGNLSYKGADFLTVTGAFENNPRFQAVSGAFETVNPELIAKEAMDDFILVATDYDFDSSYVNTGVKEFSISKDPIENVINYSYNYDNKIDFSSGQLTNFSMSIQDQKPRQLSSVKETISGVSARQVVSRTLGTYSVNGSSQDGPEKLEKLKETVSGLCSGSVVISSSYTTGENSISYNLAKYY